MTEEEGMYAGNKICLQNNDCAAGSAIPVVMINLEAKGQRPAASRLAGDSGGV